jgi:3-oxoacyl-[acyl-carrier-protein] synthase II
MGWITPLGHQIDSAWKRLLAGDCAIDKIDLFDASKFPTTFAAQVKNFDLASFVGDKFNEHKTASRNSGFAMGAAIQAWKNAGLDQMNDLDRRMIGVYLGAGEGPLDFWPFVEAGLAGWDKETSTLDSVKWAQTAYEKLDVIRELEQDPNMPAAHIAKHFGLQGPNFNCLTACAASTQALGEAAQKIARGDAEVMISGGTHSMIHPFGVTGFNRLTALSTRNDDFKTSSRPFDRDRDGFVLGEGAGVLVLESEEFAKARGANILAELAGFGSSADAYRITDIHDTGRGGMAAMRLAMAEAGVTINDIDYISAHGTGTVDNDKVETLAIKTLFQEQAYKVPVSSIKSMLGHLIAAAGAVEAIACVLAIRDQVVPPTINYSNNDPECDLDYVPNEARKASVKTCLSNSFGFGGQNDTIIIRAYNS